MSQRKISLRNRILLSVGIFTLLSMALSFLSLFKITQVSHSLQEINQVSVPMERSLNRLKTDAKILNREMQQRLGYENWGDSHWAPTAIPKWITELLSGQLIQLRALVEKRSHWEDKGLQSKWLKWIDSTEYSLNQLVVLAQSLYGFLSQKDEGSALALYPKWNTELKRWNKNIKTAQIESERYMRKNFSQAEQRVTDLKASLKVILLIVGLLSILFLWFGERALRPLESLSQMAREIARRGLKKEDKVNLPQLDLARNDEVAELAREFRVMAINLLEREKTVNQQQVRLQEQNQLLRQIGALNQSILHSIESILIVTDLEGKITLINPVAVKWLGEKSQHQLIGKDLFDYQKMSLFQKQFPEGERWAGFVSKQSGSIRIMPTTMQTAQGVKVYGGHLFAHKNESENEMGAILVLDDLTDQSELEDRLRLAEKMAAVGKMSAQVAHEVRNPLHSIGLEAEMALDHVGRSSPPSLKQGIQSILHSVDRLEKITENYLKLSRLSSGEKTVVDFQNILENVLAVYCSQCQQQGIKVDWSVEPKGNYRIYGDSDLLEQMLGNLIKNALQSFEASSIESPEIRVGIGNTETGKIWIHVQDNGPGVDPAVEEKLFTPFLTTKAQGTGLGLSFVKQVVEEHQGEVRLMKKQGACFEIMFPQLERTFDYENSITCG